MTVEAPEARERRRENLARYVELPFRFRVETDCNMCPVRYTLRKVRLMGRQFKILFAKPG